MRTLRLAIVAILLSGFTFAQQSLTPAWSHTKQDRPDKGKTLDRFALDGKYLTPPLKPSMERPKLMLECSNGKFEKVYLDVNAPVDRGSDAAAFIFIDSNLDGKRGRLGGYGLSSDGEAIFLPPSELQRLLTAHQVELQAKETKGKTVVMQFMMPDPAPVMAACGKDPTFRPGRWRKIL